jgi:uncharacterized iron-regulated protein
MMRSQQETVYTLPIGDPRRQYLLTVRPDEIVDTHRRRAVSLAEMTRLLEPATFILIGELHDNALHHQFQAQVIEALVQAGRSVIVGMEMFDRTKQPRTVPSPRLAFVILAGNGHVMYDVGISLRLRMRTSLSTRVIVPLPPSDQPMQVRAALGDFVWLPRA